MTSPQLLREQARRCRIAAGRYSDRDRDAFELLAAQLEAQAEALATSASDVADLRYAAETYRRTAAQSVCEATIHVMNRMARRCDDQADALDAPGPHPH